MRWGDLRRDGERVWWLRPGSAGGEAERLPLSVWRAITDYLAAAGRLEDIQDEDFVFTAVTANASRLPTVGERDADENRPLSEREVARMIKRYARIAGLDPRKVSPTTLQVYGGQAAPGSRRLGERHQRAAGHLDGQHACAVAAGCGGRAGGLGAGGGDVGSVTHGGEE